MSTNLSYFGLGLNLPFIVPGARSFRPPSWPPPRDWVCIEDKNGNAVSRYGDQVWNFTPWHGKTKHFNFGDGLKLEERSPVIDSANAELLRQLVVWRAWGPQSPPTAATLIEHFAKPLRRIIHTCSINRILASDLSCYPAIIDQVAKTLPPSKFNHVVAELERVRDARGFLGFELLNAAGIQRLKLIQSEHSTEQTEYIPPRIWSYLVNRVAECINDYRIHQSQIEACFAFCVSAYELNGAVEYRKRTSHSHRNPFRVEPHGAKLRCSDKTYYGRFADTAQRFGIKDLIERWVGSRVRSQSISGFRSYFQIVKYASLVDIAAFTLMRIDEVTSIRWNCLSWYDDTVFGRIPLIQGETTKTDPDDSALWITSPSVEPAILVLKSIAKMRLESVGRWSENDNPRLVTPVLEPWGGGKHSAKRQEVKPSLPSLEGAVTTYPLLFDQEKITITVDDFKIAKAVCPSLNDEQFQIGKPWTLRWHQFRRTGAVNMFASGEISDSSMQLQMKHVTRWQPLYYGRGNTTLHLNDSARVLLVNAQYESMGRQLAEVHGSRFVSPYGDEHKTKLLAPANGGDPVNLLSEGDAKHYEMAARKHLMNFRVTSLGGCMKNGQCDGDCVSAVGDCAGGDGKAPCINVLFDRSHAKANQTRLEGILKQLEVAPLGTPRYRFLEQEKRGLENYFVYIRKTV